MRLRKISHNGKILAVYLRSRDWSNGLNFLGDEGDFVQVGLWDYHTGKKLGPHKHVQNIRNVEYTQEAVFVKQGSMRATVFSNAGKLIESVELFPGDLIVMYAGGHGYEILEDHTQVLEVKNGPYTGLDDRVHLDNP